MQARTLAALTMLSLAMSCTLLSGESSDATREGNVQLYPLQIALEKALGPAGADSGETISVAVVAVVDSGALVEDAGQAAGGDTDNSAALRRERVVRHELNNSLVRNSLIDVVQPDQAVIELARSGIITANSAALSESLVGQIGELLNADAVVCAIVDLEGKEVSVAVQDINDGRLIYHETIADWQSTTAEAGEAEQ